MTDKDNNEDANMSKYEVQLGHYNDDELDKWVFRVAMQNVDDPDDRIALGYAMPNEDGELMFNSQDSEVGATSGVLKAMAELLELGTAKIKEAEAAQSKTIH